MAGAQNYLNLNLILFQYQKILSKQIPLKLFQETSREENSIFQILIVCDLRQEKQEKHSLIGFSLILLEKLFLIPSLAAALWVLRQFLEVQKKHS
jgi:hypothetical protein